MGILPMLVTSRLTAGLGWAGCFAFNAGAGIGSRSSGGSRRSSSVVWQRCVEPSGRLEARKKTSGQEQANEKGAPAKDR